MYRRHQIVIRFCFSLVCCVSIFHIVASDPKVCRGVVLSNDFGKCNNRAAELADFADDEKNRVYNVSQFINRNEDCVNEGICRYIFKLGRIRRQSFGAKTLVRISDMLHRCCDRCAKYYRHDIFTKLPDVNFSSLKSFDIVYPVLGHHSHNEMHGYHYIPVFHVPSAFYFTLGKSKQEMAIGMVMSCLKLWPLFVTCMLLSIIAGFIAWLVEAPCGNNGFPKDFLCGLYEGFWWSFITMTTVGYGDKVAKNPIGRIFSVIWILIGITICSIFVASLSTEIMIASSPVIPQLNGRQVGGLANRLEDAIMVAQHGGIFHAIDFNATVFGIRDLIKMLKEKTIEGYLISRATYFFFSRVINEKSKYKELATYVRDANLIRTEKFFKNDDVVSGMLVKNVHHYTYFKRYFESNWLQIQACYSYSLNYKDVTFDVESDLGIDGLFRPFLFWILGIMGVIFLFGAIYELIRHVLRKLRKSANITNTNAGDIEM